MLQQEATNRLTKIQAKRANKPFNLYDKWTPNPGPQKEFVESTCREILYGGAAGGGKSEALTALPLLWMHLKGFLSLTLRRSSTQLPDLLKKSERLYKNALGIKPASPKKWGGRTTYHQRNGGESVFGHCNLTTDHKQFDGWEINLLNFDELTHFTETQYKYICARVRSADPNLPTFIRATTNPGGEGHAWVFKHWGAWLDPEFEADGLPSLSEREIGENGKPLSPPAKPGEVWWIRTNADGSEKYFRSDPGTEPGETIALSRTFIPAKLSDNPILSKNDPAYAAQINTLDAVRRAQLGDGNWLIKPAAGLFFKRRWCQFVDKTDIPAGAIFVRFWDRAGTEKTDDNDPDFTVGLLMARFDNTYWVVDRTKGQWSPGKVEEKILECAKFDHDNVSPESLTVVAKDPGQAGKSQALHTVQNLSGYRVSMLAEGGSKLARFGPFSSQAEHGNVRICKGAWNDDYCTCLEEFDGQEKQHDDDADGTSGAFTMLARYRM